MSKHLETFYVFQRAVDGRYYDTEWTDYGERTVWRVELRHAKQYSCEFNLCLFCRAFPTDPGKILKVQQKRIVTVHKEVTGE